MNRNPIASVFPILLLACGGAATETPPPSTTAATSASAAPTATGAPSAAPDSSATATPYVSAVIAIPDPASPDDKTRSLHIEVARGATTQVAGATVNVLAGPRFAMAITEQGTADLHEMAKSFGTPQSSVEDGHVEKMKDDILVFTGTDLGRAGYHFEAFVETSNPKHAYACSDSGLLKVELTRADVDAMIRACKTLKH